MDIEHVRVDSGTADVVASPVIRALGIKPRLRGIPDLAATIIIVPAAAFLMGMARPGGATTGAVVYTISLAFLFGMSTTYHVPMWPLHVRAWLRRADHSAIYVLIAGSYTPVCLHALDPALGMPILWAVWGFAILGLAKSMLWPTSPRWLNTVVYVAMGWSILPVVPELWREAGLFFVAMIGAGGLLYTIGAVIYAKKLLDVRPATFGYHEVFHLFVIAAAACHYAAMWSILV
jgi:hemolysin III